ncbi:MAG TPA: hypothetical protein VGD19_01625 [Allosphingosinicella sp.]|jgi:hypothetical protein
MKPDRDQPDFKQRRSERRAVAPAQTVCRSSWYAIEVKICDVSQCGFQAECAEPVGIGSFVALEVPGIGAVQAQVRWQIGVRMGGMFLDPISLNRCEWTAVRTSPPGALV